MEVYSVGGHTEFKISKDDKVRNVSYLIHNVGQKYYSYEFDPSKEETDVAFRNFQRLLDEGRATRFDPDGGLIDGSDFIFEH